MLGAEELHRCITRARVGGWYDRFRFYRHPPSRDDIAAWLKQFAVGHHRIAGKLLDQTEVLSPQDILQGYRQAIAGIAGWDVDPAKRVGRWFFLGVGQQGESGHAMVHILREALGLTQGAHQGSFPSLTDLPKLKLGTQDTVVFVDDFSGTGSQFSKHWAMMQELVSGEARMFLLLAAVTATAMEELSRLADLSVLASRVLPKTANVLLPGNPDFTKPEKDTILTYCKLADRRSPKGWGDCGLLFVLSHKTPNNSLPILHAITGKWTGLFPRDLNKIVQPQAAA